MPLSFDTVADPSRWRGDITIALQRGYKNVCEDLTMPPQHRKKDCPIAWLDKKWGGSFFRIIAAVAYGDILLGSMTIWNIFLQRMLNMFFYEDIYWTEINIFSYIKTSRNGLLLFERRPTRTAHYGLYTSPFEVLEWESPLR
jgi:hypothetical protein